MSLWGIVFLGASTGLCRISALGCHLHERGCGRPPFRSHGAGDWQAPRRSRGDEAWICQRRLHEAVLFTPPVQDLSTAVPAPVGAHAVCINASFIGLGSSFAHFSLKHRGVSCTRQSGSGQCADTHLRKLYLSTCYIRFSFSSDDKYKPENF